MSALDVYMSKVTKILEKVNATQKQAMEKAAKIIADANKTKNSIFAFGCNHAGLLAFELFYRTGGMVTINPVRAPGMMLEITPITSSSKMERLTDYGKIIFDGLKTKKGDVMIIHSVSGRNNVTIDMAESAKKAGLTVIVLTSLEMANGVTSRHPSGKMLHHFGDVVIDNCGVVGDAVVELDGFDQKVSATSTAVGAAILNAVVARADELLLESGVTPPVFKSGNMDGGDEFNKKVIEEYKDNIFYM